MYQNDFMAVSQETLRDGTMYNLQLKRSTMDDLDNHVVESSYSENAAGKHLSFDYEDQELSNDLTGKTLEDEMFSFQQGTCIRSMGDDIRRLSISENHHRDIPMYYEYEFFSRDVMSGSSARLGSGSMSRAGSGSVFSDEFEDLDNDFDMDTEEESIFVNTNVGLKSTNVASQEPPVATTSSMALLLSGMDEDVSMNLDLDDEQYGAGGGGVKKLFKLNKMFRNNSNNSGSKELILEDEPEQIFKKKYFWSRKPTVPILRNSEPVFPSAGSNSNATFSSRNTEYGDEEVTDAETTAAAATVAATAVRTSAGMTTGTFTPAAANAAAGAAIVNPIKLLANDETSNDSDTITLSSSNTKINSLEPDLILSSNSSVVSPLRRNTTGATSISSASSSLLSHPQMVQVKKAESLTLSKAFTSKESMPTIIKKQQGVPKTRGRKPSPILDASKPFGCEFCDRRFKRQEHLKRHIRSLHICEKPYGCHLCGKKFSRSDNLSQHLKTHTHDDKE
ncbi:unnamed protein product [Kluyveromyces dobzhanskii CBS 2104]|uniref:WGS project CCBQ000000000 data, contig 00009 n=1 Tax=Kluyveromyces dobzhanskii CBS 2104 TaxID=1427455 RepID=A0A0A8L2R5_9SACH|nr:unnamed protein product [Kluyveromyces dobzhanskii CBS 2104]